jgi:hypothetical protein
MAVERSSETAIPEAPDREEIVRVIQLYIDGFNDASVDKFEEAFHDDARMTFTDADGELASYLIADCFESGRPAQASASSGGSSR